MINEVNFRKRVPILEKAEEAKEGNKKDYDTYINQYKELLKGEEKEFE